MRASLVLAMLAAMCFIAGPACSADIEILAAGAVSSTLKALAPGFEATTGDKLHVTAGPVGEMAGKLTAGSKADLVILTPAGLGPLADKGLIVAGSRKDVGSVGSMVAVKAGAPLPDIATPEALRKTLLAASSVAYVDPKLGATTGIHFAKVLSDLGIADQVAKKTLFGGTGAEVSKLVADGRAAIGVTQKSEILPVPGVTIVGPLPGALQSVSTYSLAIAGNAANRTGAEAFARYLTGPEGREKFKAAGFDPPP